jgi:hypothetical protein
MICPPLKERLVDQIVKILDKLIGDFNREKETLNELKQALECSGESVESPGASPEDGEPNGP